MPMSRARLFGLLVPLLLAGNMYAAEDPNETAAIRWSGWSQESFARAVRENKPILLFIAAGWTRASAYIDEKIFTDPTVIKLANERWVPIRVERDRRPDVELRYRVAVTTVLGEPVGFPLIAMLSKEGEVLYGKSFMPLEDRRDAPGLRSFLSIGADRYASKPGSAGGYRPFVTEALAKESRRKRAAEIAPALIEEIAHGLIGTLDAEFGGFGPAPRVPNPFTLELAATLYQRHNDPAMLAALRVTLDGMEAGAIHDRIAGGFHRMTSDAAWRRPVFEKMLNYNATLMSAYVLGWQATGNDDYKSFANRTLDWILGTLLDPEGGFYIAQSANAGSADAMDLYYSWSKEQLDTAVPAQWLSLAHTLFNVTAEGDLVLGDPPRNLLYLKMDRAEAAAATSLDPARLREGEAAILAALGTARGRRESPPVDRSVYADSTALATVSLFYAGRVLERDDALRAARGAADCLLAAIPSQGPFLHRLKPAPDPSLDPPLAMDHMMAAWALLAAFEDSGARRYLDGSINLMRRAEELFWDAEAGGFFDIVSDPNGLGYLSRRLRLNDDSGYPSLNVMASRVFDRLWLHTGDGSYHERAATCLKEVIASSEEPNHRQGGLGLALDAHLRPPTRYVIVGPAGDPLATDLTRAAYAVFDPGKVVERLVSGDEAARGAIAALGVNPADGVFAVACAETKCSGAARDVEAVAALGAARASLGAPPAR